MVDTMDGKTYQVQNGVLTETTPKVVALRVPEMTGIKYFRDKLFVPNRTSITIKAPLFVQIGDKFYSLGTDKTLALNDYSTAGNRTGRDMYIYAVQPTDSSSLTCDVVISTSSTVPSGYTADTSRKIGGFHCLCADVGTISGHWLSGYVAGDILPASVWDLLHRATSENEGMVFVGQINKWVDIYLASYSGSELQSVFGAEAADGGSTKLFHGELFNEYFARVGKRSIKRDDFVVAAWGSNEQTSIRGVADAGTTGGHYDTANRRMISNWGIEDCCGFMWQWTSDLGFMSSYGFNVGGSQFIGSSGWTALPPYGHDSNSGNGVYDSAIDEHNYGDDYGVLYRLRAGGYWADSSWCGPRAVVTADVSAHRHAHAGGRGASEPRSLARLVDNTTFR